MVVTIREALFAKLIATTPELAVVLKQPNITCKLKEIINVRPTIGLVAKFTHDILQCFYNEPIYRPTAN